ncbi:amidohydrolase family protein [candidate division KSB1 bacterium]
MFKSILKYILYINIFILNPAFLSAQSSYTLSTMPRIDVHTHVRSVERMAEYIEVSKILKDQFNVNLEIYINLSSPLGPRGEGIDYLKEVEEKFQGRFLTCLTNHRITKGMKFSPEELVEWMDRGVVGYKIWVGVSPAVDNPANDPVFTKMEQIGFIGASIHISQPYPTSWCEDPVKFWEAQNAWERVLDRHPNLKVVMAHMLDHFNSDEQLDYLRYVLETYPNLNVDLSARFQQFHRMDRENLKKFIIKYSDRILFGTDITSQTKDGNYKQVAEQYNRCFQILETDKIIPGGFFGDTETHGLALPIDVLEKIYYKNAVKLYPRIKDVLKNLGYTVE